MSRKAKQKSVIAVCIQEPTEDGSVMDFGVIKGEELKFLHQAFISDTICNALSVDNVDVRLYSIDKPERKRFVKIVTSYLSKNLDGDLAQKYKDSFSQHEQSNDRFGVRAEEIFDDCFKAGYKKIVLLGSRTPTITPSMIQTAFKMLEESDAVFGPTPEGRYYTIGMANSPKIKLSSFDWKSPSIYHDVANAFEEESLRWSELEIWYAVERLDDLEIMARDINQYRFEGDDLTGRETEIIMERLLNKLES